MSSLFFTAEDDEGDFLSPTASSSSNKLASLFGQDQAAFSGGNESLTYTAPKQPKKKSGSQTSSSTAVEPPSEKVLHAGAVHAYKYVNNQYASQGKLGAAILGNHNTHEYRILLYASKQQPVSSTKLSTAFTYIVQENNYASFSDDQRQRWSLLFDSEQSAHQFAKQVCVAIFNTSPGNVVVQQDLAQGDGQPIELGDNVEVKYTGWLLTNGGFGNVFDTNTNSDKSFRFRPGKGKVIKGWDDGVLGMRKGSKRFLVIPAAFAYGAKGAGSRIPPNATLLFEVEVQRVKFARDREEAESRTDSPLPVEPEPAVQAQSQPSNESLETQAPNEGESHVVENENQDDFRTRAASLNEHLSSSPERGSDKARLLARMSKMGKNLLNLPGAVAADPDSPEKEYTPSEPVQATQSTGQQADPQPAEPQPVEKQPTGNPTKPVKPRPQNPKPVVTSAFTPPPQHQQQHRDPEPPVFQQNVQPQQQLALFQSPFPQQPMMMPQQQPQMNYGFQPMMQQPHSQYPNVYPQPNFTPAPPPISTADATLPVLMAEARQFQSEMKLGLNKMSERMEGLSTKVDYMKQSGPSNALVLQTPGSQQAIDSSVLLHNINRIVQENEKYKTECAEKTSKIEFLNDKISQLLHRSQTFVEQNNTIFEQRNDSFQQSAAQSQARVMTLEQEKVNLTNELAAAKLQQNTVNTQVKTAQEQNNELEKQIAKITAEANKMKSQYDQLKNSELELEEKNNMLSASLKEEKSQRKKAESQSTALGEELSEFKQEKESLEKSLSERKKKHQADKRRLEEELEEMKTLHEEELKVLRERYRKEKLSTNANSAEQTAQVEAEVEARWVNKAKKMVSDVEEKWTAKYEDLTEQKDEQGRKLKIAEDKVLSLRSLQGESSKQITGLQEKIDELEGFKGKYHDVVAKTLKMKSEYEALLQEAEEERNTQNKAAYEKGLREGEEKGREEERSKDGEKTEQGAKAPSRAGGVVDEVKKIMNSVFLRFKSEFQSDKTYSGKEILETALTVIKDVTLKLVSSGGESDEESEADEETDEEEEEEEEEEEVEEDEEEEEEEEEEVKDEKGERIVAGTDKKGLKGEEEDVQKQRMTGEIVDDNELSGKIEKESIGNDKEGGTKGTHKERKDDENGETDDNELWHETKDGDATSRSHERPVGPLQLPSSEDGVVEEGADNTEDNAKEVSDETASHLSEATDAPPVQQTGLSDESEPGMNSPAREEPPDMSENKDDEVEEQTKPQGKDSSNKSEEPAKEEKKSLSLFGDDDHDDVQETFAPLFKKKELPSPSPLQEPDFRPVPPPLFDDDDDDDMDWFSKT